MLNLSSFVTTWAEPEAVEVARTHMYKNYIGHDMYPQMFVIEHRAMASRTVERTERGRALPRGDYWIVGGLYAGRARPESQFDMVDVNEAALSCRANNPCGLSSE